MSSLRDDPQEIMFFCGWFNGSDETFKAWEINIKNELTFYVLFLAYRKGKILILSAPILDEEKKLS